MAKLTLVVDPTFVAQVPIPVPGKSEPVKVGFTFKHRTREALKAFLADDALKDMTDTDLIMNVATAWELDEAFTAENVGILVQHYHAAANLVWKTYLEELTKARLGN